jgi:hypothetical protein
MSWLSKGIAVLLLAVCGLAREHCALEQVPGFEFLACCQHADKAPHQDSDCDEDGCAVFESGFFQIEDNPVLTPPPALVLGAAEWRLLVEPLAEPVRPILTSPSPPELPPSWQFIVRAALAPRAPSAIG